MADDSTVKTLVAKLVFDTSDAPNAAKVVQNAMASIAADSKTAAAQDKASVSDAIAGVQKQAEAQKSVTDAKQATAKASEAISASTAKGTEALKQQLELANKLAEATEKQNKALEAQIEKLKERKEASEKGEGFNVKEAVGKLGASVSEGAFGSGIVGGSLGAFFEGGSLGPAAVFAGVSKAIDLAIAGIGKLIERMKEFIEDSGGLQKVTDTFDKLTLQRGEDPTEFLEKLRSATHDLVNDVDLLRAANTFMQSGLKMSSEDMVKLTEATVGLARAQGNDANQAVKTLTQSFLSGRSQALGYETGIQKQLLTLTGLGPTVSQAARENLTFAQTAKLIEERYENLGQPMLTYTDRLKQIQVVQGSLFEAIAQGAVKSSGFTQFMETLGGIIERLGGMEETAKKIGDSIGNAFAVISVAVQSLDSVAGPVFAQVQDDLARLSGTITSDVIPSFEHASDKADFLNKTMQRTHPILNLTIKIIAGLGEQLKFLVNDFTLAGDSFFTMFRAIDILNSKAAPKNIKESLGNVVDAFNQAGSEDIARYKDSNKQAEDDYQKEIQGTQSAFVPLKERRLRPGAPTGTPNDQGLARREALANAKAAMEEKISLAQEGLARIKGILGDEANANDEMYKKGNETIKQYYQNKDAFAIQSYTATVEALDKEAAARKADLAVQFKEGSLFKPQYESQVAKVDSDTQKQKDAALRERNKQLSQDRIGVANDTSAAEIEKINATLEAQKTANAEAADSTKAQFEQGIISGDQYLQARTAQIHQLADLEAQAAKDRAAQELDNTKQRQAELDKQLQAYQQGLKQLSDLQNNALPQVFQQTSKQFSDALGNNSTLQQINGAGGQSITGQSTYELQTTQQALLQSQVTNMQSLLQTAIPYSDTWMQIYENISKAQLELTQLNNTMQEQYSLTSQVGGLFSNIGQQSKSLFTGTFGRGFASSFASGAAGLQSTTKTTQEVTADLAYGPQKKAVDPVQAAAQAAAQKLTTTSTLGSTALQNFTTAVQLAVNALNTMIQDLNSKTSQGPVLGNSGALGLDKTGLAGLNLPAYKSPTVTGPDGSSNAGSSSQGTGLIMGLYKGISNVVSGSSPGSFAALGKVLNTAVTAVGSFAQTIAGATSPLGGALGGGQSGAGLGASLGQGIPGLGGFGGLIGGAIGGVGGAILGAITGQKQQEVQQDIVDVQKAALAMQTAFSSGSASLQQTITTLQGLIATLTSEQANSKKGSSQFQDLINQYNQQLDQLESQQTQTIEQLTQQLAQVSSPTAYQQWIQNIDSVIQQYAQFAGAAQNATQLAQANEYLTSSLQNIGQQLGDQLMQEEESAIQNALQLNQLYNQRNQLELQYLNQVQGIMSQGNLTRQRTQAQSAFSQLYDAQVNYSQQLDSINQQINLAQYQLNVEQQIFNLATTKAGLESQLLSLQEQGVNEDMQRITAMQNLLATLQQTGYSITNLSTLAGSANDPNALQNTLLQDLVNELNTGQNTMANQLQQLINILTEYGGLTPAAGTQANYTPNASSTTAPNPNVLNDIISAAYQSRAQFAYGAFRGQNF